jgi:ABC-type uncharacterized transport system permease subunit
MKNVLLAIVACLLFAGVASACPQAQQLNGHCPTLQFRQPVYAQPVIVERVVVEKQRQRFRQPARQKQVSRQRNVQRGY